MKSDISFSNFGIIFYKFLHNFAIDLKKSSNENIESNKTQSKGKKEQFSS